MKTRSGLMPVTPYIKAKSGPEAYRYRLFRMKRYGLLGTRFGFLIKISMSNIIDIVRWQ